MRAILIASTIAYGCLCGLQAPAFAQGSAYPQPWLSTDSPTAARSNATAPSQAAPRFYNQYSGSNDQSRTAVRCDGSYDPNNNKCYPAEIHTPSYE